MKINLPYAGLALARLAVILGLFLGIFYNAQTLVIDSVVSKAEIGEVFVSKGAVVYNINEISNVEIVYEKSPEISINKDLKKVVHNQSNNNEKPVVKQVVRKFLPAIVKVFYIPITTDVGSFSLLSSKNLMAMVLGTNLMQVKATVAAKVDFLALCNFISTHNEYYVKTVFFRDYLRKYGFVRPPPFYLV